MNTPRPGLWRVSAMTTAGHVVVLTDRLDEAEARELLEQCSDALLHCCRYGSENANHVLTGEVGTVRLDVVEAVRIGYDRSATR